MQDPQTRELELVDQVLPVHGFVQSLRRGDQHAQWICSHCGVNQEHGGRTTASLSLVAHLWDHHGLDVHTATITVLPVPVAMAR